MKPIGYVRTDTEDVPRHWTVSEVEGQLVIDAEYFQGLRDIRIGQQIVVLFHFHKSPEFTPDMLVQLPRHRNKEMGIFSICSPRRPNPIGMSVLDVLAIEKTIIQVKRIDMLDGTPILDIKPHVQKQKV